jgi:carbon-monoxide dehydrogenase medium subunit
VLADADYASDPPAMLAALDARAVLRSPRGDRAVSISELILGYYETCIEPDELLVEVRVPAQADQATYRKFRSRSAEDRPCAAVAAVNGENGLRVVVGAVAETPQDFPDLCDGDPEEVAARYAERIEPLSDSRGSAKYRRRVIAAEVKRAVEAVWTRA